MEHLSLEQADAWNQILAVEKLENFIGHASTSEWVSNASKWRRFFVPSQFCGYKLARSVSIISHYPYFEYPDIFVTSDRGYLCNAVSEDTRSEITLQRARKEGCQIIGFFGGSTVQGYGSRIPDFSIPALLEAHLRRKGIPAKCLNFGVAGWTISEIIGYITSHDLSYLDQIIVYDGWNCAQEAYLKLILSGLAGNEGMTSIRDFEDRMMNETLFSSPQLFRRSTKVFGNSSLDKLCEWFPAAEPVLSSIAGSFFNLSIRQKILNLVEEDEFEEVKIQQRLPGIVAEYSRLHSILYGIGKAINKPITHYVQPTLYTSEKQLTVREANVLSAGIPWGHADIYAQFVKLLAPKRKNDLTRALCGTTGEIFNDTGHLTPLGNNAIAEEISNRMLAGSV
jgi:hypothetical protein